jgi:hypothetical protein
MSGWWTEMWSAGSGASRRYCGIARTEDGFAVDVMRGDTCIASDTHPTREAAEHAAAAYKRRFLKVPGSKVQRVQDFSTFEPLNL